MWQGPEAQLQSETQRQGYNALFNVSGDPEERTNLLAQHPEVVAAIRKKLHLLEVHCTYSIHREIKWMDKYIIAPNAQFFFSLILFVFNASNHHLHRLSS